MVVLNVKQEESLFLLETTLASLVANTLSDVLDIYNGQIIVKQICSEIELLAEYGVYQPSDTPKDLNNEISKLELSQSNKEHDSEYIPTGGHETNPDPSNRRVGLRPKEDMREILNRTVVEALAKISNENVKSNTPLNKGQIDEAISMLRGAVKIVYSKGLPEYDPVEIDFQNWKSNTLSENHKLKINNAVLWFSDKKLVPDKKLSDYFGKNEKSKVTVKLCGESDGPPQREPIFTEVERQKMMVDDEKKRDLLKVETINIGSSSNVALSDRNQLKMKMHGMQNITWK